MQTGPMLQCRRTAIFLILFGAGCGGSDPVAPPPPPPPPPVVVAISPANASVNAGATQDFSATVTNNSNTAVTWSTTGGTVTGSGNTITYTAPGLGGSYSVTATSVADATKSAVAGVTVASVAVSVAPGSQSLWLGEPVTLTATVTGSAQAGVVWTASCGTVTGTGVSVTFTAPGNPGTCMVTATSALDATKAGNSTMTVKPVYRVAAFDDVTDGGCTWTHCSMREAIAAANAQPGADTIRLVPPAGAVRATGTAPKLANATATTIVLASALPVITSSIHIFGPGPDLLTIDANGSVGNQRRVLEFSGAFPGSVTGMTLTGGVMGGGAGVFVLTNADISLTDVHVVDNESHDGPGGGLLVTTGGTARLLRVNVDNNRTFGLDQPGGGIAIGPGATVAMTDGRIKDNVVNNGWGAGLNVVNGTLTMTGVGVQGNRTVAGTAGGGGLLIDGTSSAQLTDVTVSDNATPLGEGGGLRLLNGPTVTLTNSTISDNTASLAGGLAAGNVAALTVTGGSITGNTGATRVGGVFLWGSSDVTFNDATIGDNTATTGGGGGLYLQNTAKARLNNVTISGNRALGGVPNGGGVFAAGGTLVLMTNGSIAGNIAASGGGLYAFGNTVTLTGVTVRDNIGGGLMSGGGLELLDNVIFTMTGGSVKDNQALNSAGGGIFLRSSTAQLQNVEITGNTAGLQGGAIQMVTGGTVTLTNVTVSGNRCVCGPALAEVAAGGGGALGVFGSTVLTINNSLFDNNTAGGTGGAIAMGETSQLTATDTRFTNNTSQFAGGALYLIGSGSRMLRRVTVSGNTGTAGGGGLFSSAPLLIENSTISGNRTTSTNLSTSAGGGLWVSLPGPVTIRNSTISGNTTATAGGGLFSQGPTSLFNVTVVGNTAAVSGAGLYANLATITLTNSLLSGNLRAGVAQNCLSVGFATISSTGNNLSDDATCTTLTQPTDKNNMPAMIGPLGDNGGPTRTHALLLGGVALDAGNAATCPADDQRGFGRQGVCDIGAFEFGGAAPAPSASPRHPIAHRQVP